MQDLDIRYAFIILPLIYAIIPFLLTGNFLILGAISVTIFIIGAVLFALIFSLNISGSGSILASGISGRLGINQEGTYMLFVLVFGGLFYGVTTFIDLFLNDLIPIFNFFLNLLNYVTLGTVDFIIDVHGSTLSSGSYIFTSPTIIYPTSFNVQGLAVFPIITVFMGLIYILGMFFLISSRGR